MATINEDGVITGVGAGYATIVIKSYVDTKSVVITFTINVSSVKIYNDPQNKVLFMGAEWDLDAMINNDIYTNINMKWQSSDEAIATVDQNGLVTTVSPGNVTIVARLKTDHSQYASISLTVKETESYVLTLDEFNTQARAKQQAIADKYYGGDIDYVHYITITSNDNLYETWDLMGQNCDIGYVTIIFHSDSANWSGNEGAPNLDFPRERIEQLPSKTMHGMYLLSCNAAHLDVEDNLAETLSKIVDAPVLASDGTVYLTPNSDYVYSADDETFERISIANSDNPRTENEGWVVHRTFSGKTYKWIINTDNINDEGGIYCYTPEATSWIDQYYISKAGVLK